MLLGAPPPAGRHQPATRAAPHGTRDDLAAEAPGDATPDDVLRDAGFQITEAGSAL
jgi:hypothetical protein